MNLKTSTIVGFFIAGLLLIYSVTFIALQHFSAIERDEVVEDVLQAKSLLQSEIAQLKETAEDYAGWDDTYRFVQDRNHDYIVHGLGDSFYPKMRLHLFCIVTMNGEIAYSRFGKQAAGVQQNLPSAVTRHLNPKGLFISNASKLEPTGGIIALPEGLMLVAASPVLTTESKGPVRGTLIIGRLLGAQEIKRLADSAQFNMNVVAFDNTAASPKTNGLALLLDGTQSVIVKQTRKDVVQGRSQLTDLLGQPVGFVTLEKSRQTYREARKVMLLLDLIISAAFAIVANIVCRTSKKLALVSLNEHLLDIQLRMFIEMAVDAIFKLNNQRIILNANQRAADITGFSVKELIGMRFEQLFDASELELRPFHDEQLDVGHIETIRLTLIGRNEKQVPVVIRLKHLTNDICQCIMQDLTEQVKWEDTLRRQEELLNGIVNGTNDIVYAKDLNGRYLLVNEAAAAFAGKKMIEMVGHDDLDIYPQETALTLMQADQAALTSEKIVSSEDNVKNQGGSELTFLSTRGRLTDTHGQVIGLFAILHDITIRTLLEQELLEQHNKLGHMAVKVSLAEERERVRIAEELHDQIGPTLLLSKMKLQMLQSRLQDDTDLNSCEEIDSLITQSVKDIRSLTLQLRPPILANAGLEAAIKWLAEEFMQKYNLMITLHDDGQSKPLLYEKRTIVFQAIRELLLNVVKHAQNAHTTIIIERHGDYLRVKVEDKGAGFQVVEENGASKESDGFGLFNITQKIKHIHGDITITSSPEAGTTVLVVVPLDTE